MRAYELMVIINGDVDEAAVSGVVDRVRQQVVGAGGRVANTDLWGRRRFAYPIEKKNEGYYVVFDVLAEGGMLNDVERSLRIADDIVRHKLVRLPDREAARRGLTGAPPAAKAG